MNEGIQIATKQYLFETGLGFEDGRVCYNDRKANLSRAVFFS
jgi:hypothetical protein